MPRHLVTTLIHTLATLVVLLADAASSATGEPWSLDARPMSSAHARPLQPPLACEGFCVVTLTLDGRWVAGRPECSASYEGRTYWFADGRKQAIFGADPARYLPLLGGDCPVTYRDSGKRVGGLLRHGVMHRRRPAFFASASHRDKFAQEPDLYFSAAVEQEERMQAMSPTVAAESLPDDPAEPTAVVGLSGFCPVTLKNAGRWERGVADYLYEWQGLEFRCAGPAEQAALAERPEQFFSPSGGYCPVTYWQTGERRRGHADYVAEYRDRLYLFATAEAKEKFLRNPEPYSDLPVAEDHADRNAARDGSAERGRRK